MEAAFSFALYSWKTPVFEFGSPLFRITKHLVFDGRGAISSLVSPLKLAGE
jgi:hypothetical protein